PRTWSCRRPHCPWPPKLCRSRAPAPRRRGKREWCVAAWSVPSILVQLLGRKAGQISRDVLDLLFGQAVGLRVHRRELARAAPVFIERINDVLLVLSGDARHVVFGIHRLVPGDAVTAVTGVHLDLALGGIALGKSAGRETYETRHQDDGQHRSDHVSMVPCRRLAPRGKAGSIARAPRSGASRRACRQPECDAACACCIVSIASAECA